MNTLQISEAQKNLHLNSNGYIPDTCGVCGLSGRYVLEWYGLNQYGKDPMVIEARFACGDFRHMARLAIAGHDGSVPEGIVTAEHFDEDYPNPSNIHHRRLSSLLHAILSACEDPEAVDELARTLPDFTGRQLALDLH